MLKKICSVLCAATLIFTTLAQVTGAEAGKEQKLLAPGSYEKLDTSYTDAETGFAASSGEYYTVSGDLKVTPFTSFFSYKTDTLTVDGVDFTHGFGFANYSNGQNVNSDAVEGAANAYIQYKVAPCSTVKVPVISVDVAGKPGNFDLEGFKIEVSQDGESFTDASFVSSQAKVDLSGIAYYLKKYVVAVPDNANYLRITLPKSEKVNGLWNDKNNWLAQSFLVLSAYCMDENAAVLTKGSADTLNSLDSLNGFAEKNGYYHTVSGDLSVTSVSTLYDLKSENITVDGIKFTHGFSFKNYTNGGTNTNSDAAEGAENYYVDYRVTEKTVVKVPIVGIDGNLDSNYSKFKFQTSSDGISFTNVTPVYVNVTLASVNRMKISVIEIPEGASYLRIVWPKSSEVISLWGQTQWLSQSIMMLPAYCGGKTEVLDYGKSDSIDTTDVLSNGYLDYDGEYHSLSGNFMATSVSKLYPNNSVSSITVDGIEFTHGFTFKSYSNGSTNINADAAEGASNYYIDYRVKGNTAVKIPLVGIDSSIDTNYSKFKYQISSDGVSFTDVTAASEKTELFSVNHMRVSTVEIPEGAEYLRIVWPKSSEVKMLWDQSQWLHGSLMMLPAYTVGDSEVLAPGKSDSLDSTAVLSNGYADKYGEYVRLNGNMRVNSVATATYNKATSFTFDGREFTYGYTFSGYTGENPNNDTEENFYNQYSVLGGSVVKLPLASINCDVKDKNNFDKFKLLVSKNGTDFTELDASYYSYKAERFTAAGDLDYGWRLYSVTIPNGVKYLRIVWPKSDEATPLWGNDRLYQGLSVYPAYCNRTYDITGDSSVDLIDMIRMKKYIADNQNTEIAYSADLIDCDGDGVIAAAELVELKKLILNS